LVVIEWSDHGDVVYGISNHGSGSNLAHAPSLIEGPLPGLASVATGYDVQRI
jgi:hypothetical protein